MGMVHLKDKLVHSIILAYVMIAAVLTYLAVPDTFNRAVWNVIEFFQTVNYVVNILALPA